MLTDNSTLFDCQRPLKLLWRVLRDAQNSTLNFDQSTTVLSAQLRAVAADRREIGGGEGVRTPDLRLAKPALCQTELRPLSKLKGWLRGRDLNPRPLGYEPNELPDCSTPRQSQLISPTTSNDRKD